VRNVGCGGCCKSWVTRWEGFGVCGSERGLLGGGEGVGGGIVFTLFLCRLEDRRLDGFRGLFSFSLQVGLCLDFPPEAGVFLFERFHFFSIALFRSAISCCIFIWPSRMAARSGVTPEGPEGPASTCLLTPALLRVETIFREKRVPRVFVSCPTVGANCSCRGTNKIS